jgi:response regulator NasT
MTLTTNSRRGDPSPADDPARTPATVLVVDTDPVLREAIQRILRRERYHVLADAEDPKSAWPLVRKLRPSLVLLGLTAADKRLLEAVRTIRSGSGAGVVLLAPVPNLEWIRAARAAGADVLLARPPREADLVAALEMSRARREEVARLQDENHSLRERLETATLVQQAKEVLMRRERITDSEAYQRLRRQAERNGAPVRSVAEAVVLAARVAPAV